MSEASGYPIEGGCTCRAVRYRLAPAPLFVHACHCRWCQRETGSVFALNGMIEAERVHSLALAPELVDTPSEGGAGQRIARCPHCKVAVWSHFFGAGPLVSFVRLGTLDQADLLAPNIHIFTASKQPWLQRPPRALAVPEHHERKDHWPAASLEWLRVLWPKIEAYWAACEVGLG